ncbi:ISP domain-containing protein, partial [Acephala macrosclerotiorum]
QLRAFHNVCRHRAYAVTKKECGSSTVLGCRYHGWSYDTRGRLTKAPEFDNVPGFDKEANALWEVALEVRQSLLFVNLDAGEPTQELALGDVGSLLSKWRVPEMRCISDWKFEAAFNWKLLGLPGVVRLESIQRRIEVGQEPLSSLEPIVAEQDKIDAFLKSHMEAERLAGSQIHPAARLQSFTSEGKADDDCKCLFESK